MDTCTIFIIFLSVWCSGVSIWCLMLDSKNDDLKGYLNRTENEIKYAKEHCPDEWRTIAHAIYVAQEVYGVNFSGLSEGSE